MIFLYDQPGQLCNRLWSLLPSIASSLEVKEKMFILNFCEYSDLFDKLNKNKIIKFSNIPILSRICLSLRYRNFIHHSRKNIFDLLGIHLVEGWVSKSDNVEYIIKYSDLIRNIFEVKKEVKLYVDKFFSSLRYDIVIGVHIRKGDYNKWFDGKYFFADTVYSKIISDLDNSFKLSGKRVGFLLCSNEKLDLSNFPFNCFTIPKSSTINDLYALSKCSYIVGPPSTYSQWASFYGKVPLKFIMTDNFEIDVSSFSPIIALDRFENGASLLL